MTKHGEKAGARVAQEIVRAIYDEGLVPGDHYLSEADALKRHGISRATFREALRFLEFQGVVGVRAGPGGGTIVRQPDWSRLTSTFALLLQFADASLDDVMAARTALEPSMIALTAEHATPEQLAEIAQLIDAAEAGLAEPHAFEAAWRGYWATMARASGNPVTALLWPALRAIIDSGGFVPNERHRRVLIDWMRRIAAAVAARDLGEAHDLLERLNKSSADRLRDNYPKRFAQRVAWSDVSGAPAPEESET